MIIIPFMLRGIMNRCCAALRHNAIHECEQQGALPCADDYAAIKPNTALCLIVCA